ncbi:LAT2 domain-containing protein [Melanotaenia boesemani]|uniref:LAT2 domain-containing protein n=1 Tax=Melanotaenia boesemani TaxID=1250792 RepID=UPI001C059291|nr:LAT2 domain-containing protein [Melanotaenia boesemani]
MVAATEGMTGAFGLLAAVLTVVSVASLSLFTLFCLRCKKKEKIIHEEPQIYNPQIFQRGGSQFAVMRSKTVTRSKQTSSTENAEHSPRAPAEEQADYQNITEFQTVDASLEHDYVAPIPVSVYENQKRSISDADPTPGIYGNVFPPMPTADDDDYENSAYLNQIAEADEPDYENES